MFNGGCEPLDMGVCIVVVVDILDGPQDAVHFGRAGRLRPMGKRKRCQPNRSTHI